MTSPALRALLEDTLATWRRTGSPEDAAAFDARAEALLVVWTPPASSSERSFHRAWLRAVDDAIGRGWALNTLLEQLPGADPVQRASALAKRLEALARHGPDPRFERAAAGVRGSGIDVSLPRLGAALARLEATAPAKTDASLPVVHAFPAPTADIAALWHAVQANPDDDGPLHVLADALQGVGDPRGELLALQLGTGGDHPARLARLRMLIASCGAAWLGDLAPVTAAASFERGVLRRLQLSRVRHASHPSWSTLAGSPALATVTDLVGTDVDSEVYARFVTSPAMRSLARIDVFDRKSLAALKHAPPSLAHVACFEVPGDVRSPLLGPAISALRRQTNVTSVAIAEAAFHQLADARWFRRLSAVTLGVGTHIRRGLTHWAALSPSMTLTLVPDARLPACTSSFPWDFGITLAREGRTTTARIGGEWLLLPLDVLTALPPDVARVEVDHPSEVMADRIRSALARPAVEVVHRPVRRLTATFVPAP